MLADSRVTSIPVVLQERRQWVAWRYGEQRADGKREKVPICPGTGRNANVGNPTTWGTFAEAIERCQAAGLNGIGYILTKSDPHCAVDLDDCRDPTTGVIEPWAMQIVDALDTYTEVSPSGTGLRLLLNGRVPHGWRNENRRIELYGDKHYVTITGELLPGRPRKIRDCQAQLEELCARELVDRDRRSGQAAGNGATVEPVATSRPAPPTPPLSVQRLSDDELVAIMLRARNGAKFLRLWSGNTTDYPSPSEATLALCRILAFYTSDPARMYRLLQRSGLMRAKVREARPNKTWGWHQVQRAFADQVKKGEFFQGPPPGQRFLPPCPRQLTLLMRDPEQINSRRALDLRCHCWSCRECVVLQRQRWTRSLTAHLAALPTGTVIFHTVIAAKKWRGTHEQIRKQRGHYVAIKRRGQLLIFTTTTLPGWEALSVAEAMDRISGTVTAIPVGTRTPISTSRSWRLPKRKASDWNPYRVTSATSANRIKQACDVAGISATFAEIGGRVQAITEYQYAEEVSPLRQTLTDDLLMDGKQPSATTKVPPNSQAG